MNIFEMNVNEIDDIMNNILNEITPEMLMKELKECGYKNVEITDIEVIGNIYDNSELLGGE
ncbi:MAG: YopX family protein [Clostridia bacterium]